MAQEQLAEALGVTFASVEKQITQENRDELLYTI